MAPRLDRIQISNFRCLKWVDVPLRPLTVLIGPNDSGKSAFLGAIRHLLGGGPGLQQSDYWQQETRNQLVITPSVTGGQSLRALQPVGFYQLPSQGVAMEAGGVDDSSEPPKIGQSGEGVSTLLDYLLRRDRKRFFAVVDALHELVPGLADLEISTPHPSNRRLMLVIENGLKLDGNLASTGVRILIVFLALAYHPSPPRTILLEEPENGVHPKRLADIMRLLREITEGKHGGQPAQVVLTTHSPYLLDLVDLDRDQLLVFRRNEDGSRTAEPADRERLKLFLDEFMLGEVWYNQGEEGLVARGS
jgi:predicted ATPase